MSGPEKDPGNQSEEMVDFTGQSASEQTDHLTGKLEHAGGFLHDYFARLPDALGITRKDVILMHREIEGNSDYRSVGYWLFLATACGIATLGLIINSPAVIIGAMLVSPLMGPILGLGLGIAATDIYLGIKGLLLIAVSMLVSILTAALITLATPFKDATPEILGRTFPTLLDLFIALFCGIVAALSSVRSDGKAILGSAAPGAAIGVALMPPLCVAGFGLASLSFAMFWGGTLLFLTNLVAIILASSGFYYFIYEGYRFGGIIALLGRVRHKKEWLFRELGLLPRWKSLTENISTRKRFFFPVILLLLISYPLSRSLLVLKKKIDVRNFISRSLEGPGTSFLRGPESLTYTPERVSGTIFYSSSTDRGDLSGRLKREIAERFDGYEASIAFVRIAKGSDISALKETGLDLRGTPEYQDSLRDRHARELAERAIQRLHQRFPPAAGLIYSAELRYGASGLHSVVIRYVGVELKGQALELQTETIQRELKLWRPELRTVELRYAGPATGRIECGPQRSAETARDFLRDFLGSPDRNPKLHLTLKLDAALRPLAADTDAEGTPPADPASQAESGWRQLLPGQQASELKLEWVADAPCLVDYRFD